MSKFLLLPANCGHLSFSRFEFQVLKCLQIQYKHVLLFECFMFPVLKYYSKGGKPHVQDKCIKTEAASWPSKAIGDAYSRDSTKAQRFSLPPGNIYKLVLIQDLPALCPLHWKSKVTLFSVEILKIFSPGTWLVSRHRRSQNVSVIIAVFKMDSGVGRQLDGVCWGEPVVGSRLVAEPLGGM